jgi:hypothetical protein
MTPKGLDCLSCPVAEGDPENQEDAEREDYSLSDFTEVEISGLFDATISKGSEYAVEFTGSENEKEKYKISKEGSTLVIEYNDDNRRVWDKDLLNMDEIKINISMPNIERLDANLTGAVEARGNLDAKDLNINLTGASQLELEGTGHTMDAQIQGASSLRAFSFKVKDASVEVNGASSAKVNVSGTLEMEEGIASDIDYRGKPQIIKRN